jgi:hypothetical protein
LHFLNAGFQSIETRLSDLPVRAQLLSNIPHRFCIQLTGTPLRVSAATKQARVLRDLVLLRYCRPADVKPAGQLRD